MTTQDIPSPARGTTTGPSEQSILFGGLSIDFDDRVLRPRDWTLAQSTWAEALLDELPAGPVLELCSGAGHIGLRAIAARRRHLVAVDLDPVACDYIRRNAAAAGLADLVDVRQGAMVSVLETAETFPLIIADPPWVPRADLTRFPEDPELAIDGGDDGMHVARMCLALIDRHLAPGGSALLQLGTVEQACEVGELLDSDAFGSTRMNELRTYERGVVVRLDHA